MNIIRTLWLFGKTSVVKDRPLGMKTLIVRALPAMYGLSSSMREGFVTISNVVNIQKSLILFVPFTVISSNVHPQRTNGDQHTNKSIYFARERPPFAPPRAPFFFLVGSSLSESSNRFGAWRSRLPRRTACASSPLLEAGVTSRVD